MNVAGAMIHTHIDPVTLKFTSWQDKEWTVLGDKFVLAGLACYGVFLLWAVVINGFRKSFARFKQEQHDLLYTIDNSDKRGRR